MPGRVGLPPMRWFAIAWLWLALPLAAKTCGSELEVDVMVCSVAWNCKTCGGAGVAVCPSCHTVKGSREVARRRELALQWRHERAAASKPLGAPKDVVQCRSAHFDVA